mgnify:CR=1 FL=1
MREVTVKGKTVEEAVEQALSQLNVTRDRVKVTVIDEAKKGFFGIGGKPAVVKISELPDAIDEAENYLRTIVEKMGMDVTIQTKEDSEQVFFDLSGDEIAVLIGKRGQTLNALQYLTNLVANRHADRFIRVQLDAENYRERRRETLHQLAIRLAEKAQKLNRKIVLDSMPAHERKIIHLALKDVPEVSTVSEGVEPNRYVVILPSSQDE